MSHVTQTQSADPYWEVYMDLSGLMAMLPEEPAEVPAHGEEEVAEPCCLSSLVSLVYAALEGCLAFIQSFWADPNPGLTLVSRFVEEWRQPAAANEQPQEVQTRWREQYKSLPQRARRAAETAFGQKVQFLKLLDTEDLKDIEAECSKLATAVHKFCMEYAIFQQKVEQSASVYGLQKQRENLQRLREIIEKERTQQSDGVTSEDIATMEQLKVVQEGNIQGVEQLLQALQAKLAADPLTPLFAGKPGQKIDPTQVAQGLLDMHRRGWQILVALKRSPRSEVVLNALEEWCQTQQQG